MPKITRRPAPRRTETLDDGLVPCPECGRSLVQAYHRTRLLVTLSGTLRLLLKVRTCRNKGCRRVKKAVRPFGEGRYSLPRHAFGLDVIAQVGTWRSREHASVPEMHCRLQQAGVPICERTVTHLLDRSDELVARSMLDPARLSRLTAEQQQVSLALDGIQPDVGHEVLWVLRACLSGEVLLARALLSAPEADLASLLREGQEALPVRIGAVVSDGQPSIRKAVASALPGVPLAERLVPLLREAQPAANEQCLGAVVGAAPTPRAAGDWTKASATQAGAARFGATGRRCGNPAAALRCG